MHLKALLNESKHWKTAISKGNYEEIEGQLVEYCRYIGDELGAQGIQSLSESELATLKQIYANQKEVIASIMEEKELISNKLSKLKSGHKMISAYRPHS